jgi:MFS family permease
MLHAQAGWLVVLAFATGLSVHAFMYGPQGAFIAEQFPARVRYAGSSIAYTFAGVFAGGLAPLAFTKIYQLGKQTGPIVVYAGVALAITVVALLKAPAVHANRPD